MATPYLNQAAAQSLPAGYRLGEYAIEAVLGHGGFGITYRARDTQLGADVAIKEYFPEVYASRAERSTIVPRPGADLENYRWGLGEFLKEAQALAKFKHPHIVRVLRFLEANGTAYTIMEYEQGETLSSYLDKHGGRLDEPSLLRIFLPTLNGLQAVHDAGLLHLDIKPDNIYLRQNGEPVLIDFGSSRQMRGDASQKVTLTPGYCALEQYPGHGDIGVAADVYGIGATLYRCVTGVRPVDALERHTTFARSRVDPLRPAVALERPFYSAHIRQCIDAAMQLSAQARPASPFVLQQGLMGKDMAQVGKPMRADVVRIGQGFIGAAPAPPPVTKRRRQYSFFEKSVAVFVFAATLAVVIPKLMIDTGRMTDGELYEHIDATTTRVVAKARALGDAINEHVFGVVRRPETTTPPRPVARAPVAQPPNAPVADTEPPPFGARLVRAPDVVLPEPPAHAFVLLKHGTVFALASADGPVRLWDALAGSERVTVPARIVGPAALGVFPSSQWFAADIGHTLVVFDPLGNRDTVIATELADPIGAITVSAEHRLLAAASEGGQITIWALSPTRRLHTLPIDGGRTRALAFTPDERALVVGGANGSVTLWDAQDGRRLHQWRAHGKTITAVAWSSDGRTLATTSVTGDARLWAVDADSVGEPRALPGAGAQHLAFSADGRWVIAAGVTAGIRVFETATGALVHEIDTDGRGVRVLALAREGNLLAALGDDNVVRMWR